MFSTSDCQDDFSNETINVFQTNRIYRDFRVKELEIRQKKSMLAGLVKHLPSARMDYTVP